jgi:membrane protease YdiL (CAAX protease family)
VTAPTPYHVLELREDATDDEIRSAYRRLSARYDPDVNPDDEQAAARFREVQAAYDFLTASRDARAGEVVRYDAVWDRPPPGRLVGWAVLVGLLTVLNYANHFWGEDPPDDFVYRWDSAIGGVVQFGFMLAIILVLARGPWFRELLGLRAPDSWGMAVGLSLTVLVGVYILAGAIAQFLDPGEEQGLVPEQWDPDRLPAFVANFVVIALFAPIVEEVTFRGLGYGLLRRYGVNWAVGISSVTWALGHGLIEALAIFIPFGVGLAYLRLRTSSLYPCIALHSVFNAVALSLSVLTAD